MIKLIFTSLLTLGVIFASDLCAQNKKLAVVDQKGVLRWSTTNEEIKGFGANYTLPFAYGYRQAIKKGLNPEELIKEDVYHFARLGFDLFRVHIWDTEISDTAGNLLDNEQLRLFDFLIFHLKQRGIRAILTPIAFWGNGWPEKDTYTPGFSHYYGKQACLTNPAAISAQQRYLSQFLNHLNPYTGLRYKEDDDIIAFEISNEPHHRESIDSVKKFINGMVDALRSTGTRKPIFYNISHSLQSAQAYFNTSIQGGTFQWYPTGLGAQHELQGNFLPHVDSYPVPYEKDKRYEKLAKIVYEFDAADIGRSYIYPAMARSLRAAGMQLATHFAYDPTYSAYANTEYGTHYMNLLYTPQKALSLMIAGEVFKRIPRYSKFEPYPVDTLFGPFSVHYTEDLALLCDNEKFIYTNNTTKTPKRLNAISQIAGYGSSPLISYNGKGAYFLDKISEGIWRLEINPDATWLKDPFGPTDLNSPVATINYKEHTITISLPDLGKNFNVFLLNDSLRLTTLTTKNESFSVRPGIYLLQSNQKENLPSLTAKIGQLRLNERAGRWGLTEEVAIKKELTSESAEAPAFENRDNDEIILFDAKKDANRLIKEWRKESGLHTDADGATSWETQLPTLRQFDPEFPMAELPRDYTLQAFIGDRIKKHNPSSGNTLALFIEMCSPQNDSLPILFSIVSKDGSAFGTNLNLQKKKSVFKIPLEKMEPLPFVLLPRPYPGFLPYFFERKNPGQFQLSMAEQLQISLGPGIKDNKIDLPYRFRIYKIWLSNVAQ